MKTKSALPILTFVLVLQMAGASGPSLFELPQTVTSVDEIRARVGTKDAQGNFVPTKAKLQELEWNQTKFLVATIDPSMDNEPYLDVYLYCYNDHFKEWRCLQTTHFCGANEMECKLDETKGVLTITDATNNPNRGRVLMTFNLAAAYH